MKKGTAITVTGAEEIPTEIMATAIIKISEASAKMLATGLNRTGLLVLLKHATNIPMADIDKILQALPKLAQLYVVTKKPGRRK